ADAPAHQQTADRHDHQAHHVDDHIADGAPDQHRHRRHRQRAEPVDDALLHVLGQARTGEGSAEDHGLAEDARDQELAVAAFQAGHVDRGAEHVGEQQHEHDRRERGEDQHVWHALDLDDIAFGDGHAVGDEHGEPARQTGFGAIDRGGSRTHRAAPSVFSAGRAASAAVSESRSASWPVRVRNTSSSDGRRSPTSWICTPAAPSSPMASTRACEPLPTGTTSRRSEGSRWMSPSASGFSTRSAAGRVAAESTVSSMRSPPTMDFSSSAVPRAMTLPWSMTAMASASRSASSMYWVVSSRVVPPATSSSMTSHRSSRARGSSPVVGSSRNSTGGLATSAPARSSLRRMPPEKRSEE